MVKKNNEIQLNKKAKVYNAYGKKCFKLKKFEAALKWFNRAIKFDVRTPLYLVNRAAAYNKLKQYQDAICDLNGAIALDTKNSQYLDYRGLVHYKLGNFKKVIDDLNEAIKSDDKNLKYYYRLARAHYKENQYTEVVKYFDKVNNLGKNIARYAEYKDKYQQLVVASRIALNQLSNNENKMFNKAKLDELTNRHNKENINNVIDNFRDKLKIENELPNQTRNNRPK